MWKSVEEDVTHNASRSPGQTRLTLGRYNIPITPPQKKVSGAIPHFSLQTDSFMQGYKWERANLQNRPCLPSLQ